MCTVMKTYKKTQKYKTMLPLQDIDGKTTRHFNDALLWQDTEQLCKIWMSDLLCSSLMLNILNINSILVVFHQIFTKYLFW